MFSTYKKINPSLPLSQRYKRNANGSNRNYAHKYYHYSNGLIARIIVTALSGPASGIQVTICLSNIYDRERMRKFAQIKLNREFYRQRQYFQYIFIILQDMHYHCKSNMENRDSKSKYELSESHTHGTN